MEILIKENYINAIKNSIGSNLFHNLYAEVDGEKKDILNDGELSCAYFVSSILYLFKMIAAVHATVDGTVRDLKEFAWIETSEPKTGDVIVWKKTDYSTGGTPHKHIGFYMRDNKVISNDFEAKSPIEHDINFRNREIEMILSKI